MILLFTDFGYQGPYVGELHLAIAKTDPAARVIDLMHDAPALRPQPAAYLLAALVERAPPGSVVTAVVDPGVGGARRPLAVAAGGRWLVGPDNGLLVPAARRLGGGVYHEITWRPERLSASFHGRDLFAPFAAHLHAGRRDGMIRLEGDEQPPVGNGWPEELSRVLYTDRYGNVVTGLRADAARIGRPVRVGQRELPHAVTFSDRPPGEAFWYANSAGLVELAVNRGRADALLGLGPDDPVELGAAG